MKVTIVVTTYYKVLTCTETIHEHIDVECVNNRTRWMGRQQLGYVPRIHLVITTCCLPHCEADLPNYGLTPFQHECGQLICVGSGPSMFLMVTLNMET